MVDILKTLKEYDLAIGFTLIGLVREARLWHKHILEDKRLDKK